MHIHEYQAKDILRTEIENVPNGVVLFGESEINSVINEIDYKKYVVKAQIHAGGRGKAGGVKLVSNKSDLADVIRNMFGSILVTPQTGEKGKKVNRIYIEEACNIDKELYLSFVIDQEYITIIASEEGGMDIEEIASSNPEKILQIKSDLSKFMPFHIRQLTKFLNITDKSQVKIFSNLVSKLCQIMIKNDLTQLEINPLVITKEGQILILDCKAEIDDNAIYRQKILAEMRDEDEEDKNELEASFHQLNYVSMDGTIACLVNGAGLAMATMDIIKLYGKSPANFLDVGGGVNKERVKKAFEIILSDDKVETILINIFGGIVKCDIIANGLIDAATDMEIKIPLVVRLSGTNSDIAKDILSKAKNINIKVADKLEDAAQLACK